MAIKKTVETTADKGKLNPTLLHDFYPVPDDKSVYFEVEHLKNGELMNYMDMMTQVIDYPKMFEAKVKKVHGIEIEDKNGNSVEVTPMLITSIADSEFSNLVTLTCVHLITKKDLSEFESKN